jgi:hypothetical protein
MLPRPKHHKRTHLKHPGQRPGKDNDEQTWLKRFWIVFALIGMIAVSTLTYFSSSAAETEDAYVSLQTRTVVGSNRNVSCKLSLLVSPAQETALLKRRPELENTINAALAEIYAQDGTPPLSNVRENLLERINDRLPQKLAVREVLIQELLVGNSY